jgi:RimJ/RimL family protein N-acetyltransferase
MPAALPGPPERDAKFGGAPHHLRPLHRGDEECLRAFFRSHTPETVYERYGYPVSEMSFERALQLVNIDPARDCALGIFESGSGGEALNAVGRYCLDADGRNAELAFVVRESKRNLGMASCLLRTLIQAARGRGLHSLWAQVSAGNGPMIAVFRRHGFESTAPGLGGEVKLTLALGAQGPGPRRGRSRSAGRRASRASGPADPPTAAR